MQLFGNIGKELHVKLTLQGGGGAAVLTVRLGIA